MAINLSAAEREKLVRILSKNQDFRSETDLRTLVDSTFTGVTGGGEIIDYIDVSGAPAIATQKLVLFLQDQPALPDGSEALIIFLEKISSSFGDESQQFFSSLISSFPAKTFRPGAPAPQNRPLSDLLYYKVDHIPQVDLVSREITRMRSQAQSLLLCVVQGSWNQAPDKLMERMKVEIVPEALGLETLKPYALAWPDTSTSLSELSAQFEQNLAKEVFAQAYDTAKTSQDIQSEIARQSTLVHTSVASDTFALYGVEGLEKYLEFWDAWPPLAPTQRLFVYLFLESNPAEKQGFLGLFTRSPQEKLDRFLERIKTGARRNAQPVVLPPLSGAKKQHATNWVSRDEVASRCEVSRVQVELGKYYQLPNGRDKESAPVLELVDNLKAWIAAYPRQTNGG